MTDRFWSAPLHDGREICISPLARTTVEQALDSDQLGDDYGYFIYEYDARAVHSGIEILAKAASYAAAVRLVDIYVNANQARSRISGVPSSADARI